MTSRNILSIAWIGRGDFGDEAMAYALRQSLKRGGMSTGLTYYHSGPGPTYHGEDEMNIFNLHGPTSYERFRRLSDRFLLNKFNTVLIGGGSLFHSEHSISWKHEIIRQVKSRHGSDALVACVGISAGPFASPSAEEQFDKFLCDVDVVISRDENSSALISKMGFSKKLFSAVDLSFLLPDLLGDAFPYTNVRGTSSPIGLAFIVKRGESQSEAERKFGNYLKILNTLLDQNRKITLFTLYTGEIYLDGELNKKLKEKAVKPALIEIHTFNGDILRTAEAISKCSAILSMRLHGIIFSYLSGVPFVSLGYDPKNKFFCETMGYPSRYVFDEANLPSPAELVNSLLDSEQSRGGEIVSDQRVNMTKRINVAINHLIGLLHETK